MKRNIRLITVCVVSLVAAPLLHGQQLTPEQLAADKKKQDALAESQAASIAWAAHLPPKDPAKTLELKLGEEYLTEKMLEASILSAQASSKKLRITTSDGIKNNEIGQVSLMSEGGGWSEEDLGVDVDCAPSPYQWYGIRKFDSGYWFTGDNSSIDELPWYLSNTTVTGTNGYGLESYPTYYMPSSYCRGYAYYNITNNFDQNGDPQAHRLAFFVQFTKDSPADTLRCSVAYVTGDPGIAYTNIPASSSWQRVSLIVPPYTGNNPKIYFTIWKQSTRVHVGPFGNIDLVQWCTIPTPQAKLRINKKTDGMIHVEWDTTYGTNHWNLQYANDPAGVYATYAGTITLTNNTLAYAEFNPNEDNRFYRLKHK